jgi:hypothetical protein
MSIKVYRLFACGIPGATHTFMWVGECVQREAQKTHLPRQVGLWQGEPTSNEGATATESAPQRTVEVGGQSPGAERSAAPLWVGRASSPMMRQQHKMRTSQTIRSAALAEGSRALHGAPEDGPHPSAGGAKRRKANRNRQIGRPAQSIRRSWRQPTSRMEAVWCVFMCAERGDFLRS